MKQLTLLFLLMMIISSCQNITITHSAKTESDKQILIEMDRSGWIEFGAHTRHHVDLTKQTEAKIEDQVLKSKRMLEEKIGHRIIAFAYPSGKYNDTVVNKLKLAGFEFAVTTKPGYAAAEHGLLTLHRVRVPGDQSAKSFAREFP